MMYNDVDNDLPPFNDTIDGEEIFLFSNTKNSSTGASFLNEDDDEHLRHQHHNVVAGTSSHLPVDVDELLLNSNFLEQPNCDQSDDPLFWNCKDISDDHLNDFLPSTTQNQLNLSNNSNNGISNNNNINNNNATTTTTTSNSNNNHITNIINNNNNTSSSFTNSIFNTINQLTQHIPVNQHSQQSIIPIQHIQTHNKNHQIGQHQIQQQQQPLAQQILHQQLRLQQHQLNPIQQQVTTNLQQPAQLQQEDQLQPSIFQPQQQQSQIETKWITLVQTNDIYSNFNPTTQQQFFDKVPQTLIQTTAGVVPTLQTSNNNIITPQSQVHIQQQPQTTLRINQQQPQPSTQQQQQTHQQQQTQQQQTVIHVQQYQPMVSDKPKISVPISSSTTKTTADDNVTTSKKQDVILKQKPKEKQTRLDCPYCKRSFSKNFDLQQHMRCHTGEKPFQCIVCGRGFAQKSNVKKHMQAHKVWPEGHNNVPLPASLINHARSRNNSASSSIGTPRNDDECMQENDSLQINNNNDNNNNVNNNGITLGLSNDRKNDGNDIFAENRYSCSYCQFNGRTYFELKSHLTVHKREKVFKCIVSSCGKTFSGSDLQGFLDHVTGHKDLIYHCHLCSGQFYSLDEFGEHQKNHSNIQSKRTTSNISNSATTTTSNLSNQIQQHATVVLSNQQNNNTSLRQQNQQVISNQLQPQQNQRQYNQQQSQNQAQSNNDQKNSQLSSNNNSNNNINNSNSKNNNSQLKNNNQKYFRCTKCMSRYTTQSALDHHLSISTHYFPCTECNKVFACERYLRRHLNTHTAIQHVCTFCDKQFKTAAYLKMHSVVHTGEKPFRCNLCEAAFNRRDKLNRHKLTHETVKKFKCPFKPHIGCTKEFNRPDKLKAHVLTHSGIRPHPCDSCTRTFSRLSRLREHKKLHHDNNNNNIDIKPASTNNSNLKIKEEPSSTSSVIAIEITSSTSNNN